MERRQGPESCLQGPPPHPPPPLPCSQELLRCVCITLPSNAWPSWFLRFTKQGRVNRVGRKQEGAWEVVMLASSPGQRAGTQLAAQRPVVLL